jgi:DNA-binding transcriptional LysR family regulator
MEFRQLRYFVAVAEELNFGKAAERLYMTQPALSKQIQTLEKKLEIELFKRTKREVQLTQAGQVFLEQAKRLLKDAEQGVQLAKQAARGEIGQLIISYTPSALHSVLPEILRVFGDRYPDVKIAMTEMSTEKQVEALQEHQVDVAFLHPPLREKFLQLQLILEEEILLVLPKNHPLLTHEKIPLSALAKESFIIHPPDEGPVLYNLFVNTCLQAGFQPKVVQEAVMCQTRIALVEAGIGITFVPESIQNIASRGVVYKRIDGVSAKLQLATAWRKENSSPVLQKFLQLITEIKKIPYLNKYFNIAS